ncbi:MAG: ribose 5-phosphate isomerase B [Pyrinomonas sp.]|uniref:ribose 5-phosphate isomerase B n=1 Tax=Pyrinomonas sp. TaxID=2080306 RepID=UPI0033332B6C
MKIALASDHAGFKTKEELKPLLDELGIVYEDVGTHCAETVDYPDFAHRAALLVARGECAQALLICGSGTGMAIAANKVPGIRAAVAWNEQTARLARAHNDANVLAIGARTTASDEIVRIVRAWFAAQFEGGRHARRIQKIHQLEALRAAS